MSLHHFAAGEHDPFICGHILDGTNVSGSVEHDEHEDGSVSVEYPGLTALEIANAIATYDPNAPKPSPAFRSMTAAEIAAAPAPAGALTAVKVILTQADADITAAEIKVLVLLMARYFYRKWLDGWR